MRERPNRIHRLHELANDRWWSWNRNARSVFRRLAYALWRLNWIHPFGDGNGRTARAICDAILCVGFGRELPGTLTIHEQISNNRYPYWDALKAADRAWKDGALDVSEMETLIAVLLERQLGATPP